MDFKSEKEFCNYLEINKDFWVKDFFGEEIKSFKREWCLSLGDRFGPKKPKIDFCVITKSGKRIGIECKNPKYKRTMLTESISQLLGYGVIAENNGVGFDELALFTSDYDDILEKVIKKYHLPIRVFLLTRKQHGELTIWQK